MRNEAYGRGLRRDQLDKVRPSPASTGHLGPFGQTDVRNVRSLCRVRGIYHPVAHESGIIESAGQREDLGKAQDLPKDRTRDSGARSDGNGKTKARTLGIGTSVAQCVLTS